MSMQLPMPTRSQATSLIRTLGFKPGDGKKKSGRMAKHVGPNGEVWTGVGAMASWLRKLKDAGQDVEQYRVSG
jgi:DNA-binding protein H-NS